MSRTLFAALLLIGCGFGQVAVAQSKATEMAGANDHPMVSRYAGSVLHNATQENFVALRVPGGPGRFGASDKLVFDKFTAVEGRVSSYFYIQLKERSALEVFRNYQAALLQAGFTTLYACEMRDCDLALIKEAFAKEVVQPRKWADGISPASSIDRDVRFVSAKANRNGADVFVMVFVAEPNSIWQAPVAVVLVAEPAAMEAGKVVISTDKLQRGLADEGKITLYGLYFDTAKAEVKPESKPQLAEMAKLLQANKALKVLIVGHTDNQGTVDANLALSQKRAEAVVAALVADHKIDAARLRARGVANFSPVTSNGSEAGRAKNRRVELVEQ
jgi:OmpA-OmpF porin, OOP family